MQLRKELQQNQEPIIHEASAEAPLNWPLSEPHLRDR
jgi:hypothetical protein